MACTHAHVNLDAGPGPASSTSSWALSDNFGTCWLVLFAVFLPSFFFWFSVDNAHVCYVFDKISYRRSESSLYDGGSSRRSTLEFCLAALL